MIYFVVPREQEFGIRDYLEAWGGDLVGLLSILHYEDLPGRTNLPAGAYIFSALDQLTPGGLCLVREIQKQLKASLPGCRVLNDASIALSRLELLEELYRQGLNRHKAVRATGNMQGLRFPVFLHEEFRHTGSLSPLLHNQAQLETALGRAAVLGHRLNDLLVIEFLDTADQEARYRKYAAYVVGSEVIARTMGRGRNWMLKAESVEFSEEMLREERAYVLGNPYEDQLRRIFALAGIEYGRIDFSLKDGIIETWEINTNPSVGPSRHQVMPDEFVDLREPIRNHFNLRFHAAMRTVDRPASGESIPLAFSGELLRGASPMLHPPLARGVAARALRAIPALRPLFDLAEPVLAPLLARAIRRVNSRQIPTPPDLFQP